MLADVSYEDLDDYSPVVSDYEDNNDDASEDSCSKTRTDKVDNYNLIDQILNQSSNRDDDDVMELGETEDTNPDPNTGMYCTDGHRCACAQFNRKPTPSGESKSIDSSSISVRYLTRIP